MICVGFAPIVGREDHKAITEQPIARIPHQYPLTVRSSGLLTSSTGGAYYAADDEPALARALNATVDTFPFTVADTSGKTVAQGRAGDAGIDLPAGEYTLIVEAGSQRLTLPHVAVVSGQRLNVRIGWTPGGFVLTR